MAFTFEKGAVNRSAYSWLFKHRADKKHLELWPERDTWFDTPSKSVRSAEPRRGTCRLTGRRLYTFLLQTSKCLFLFITLLVAGKSCSVSRPCQAPQERCTSSAAFPVLWKRDGESGGWRR